MKNYFSLIILICALFAQNVVTESDSLNPIELEGVEIFSSLRQVNEGDLASSAIVFSDELELFQGQHFSDLLLKVPNLNYAGGTSRPRFFQVRGEGSVSRYADQGPPSPYVGLVLDGMDLSELGMITPLFDMQQVEVLMGVQTSLFGASASSGLINFKTNDPTDEEGGYAMMQLGSYNTFTNGLVYNLPFENGWKLRLVGHSNVSDGYKENVAIGGYASANKNETSLRVKLLKEGNLITQKYTVIASDFDNGYDNWSPDNNTDNITYSDNPGKDSQKSQIFIADYRYDLGEQIVDLNVGISSNETLHSYDSDWGNYSFWLDEPYSFNPDVEGYQYDFFDSFDREIDTRTTDLRFKSNINNNNKVDYVFGLYNSTYEETTDAAGYIFGGSSTGLSTGYDITTKSVYGELAFNFDNSSTLAFAFRNEARDIDYFDFENAGASFELDGDWNTSYKVSYELHPKENLHWYIYAAEGYHPAGVNQNPYLDMEDKTYDDEIYIDLTTGIRWYTDNIKLSTSLFYLEHDGHIFETSEQLDPSNPNAFAFFKQNADSGYEYGSETSGKFKLNDRFSMGLSLGLLSGEIEFGDHAEHGDEHGEDDHDEDHDEDHDDHDEDHDDHDEDHDDHDEHEGHAEHGKKAHAPNWNYSLTFNYNFTEDSSLMVEIAGKDAFVFDSMHDEYESEPYHLLNAYYSQTFDKVKLGFYAKNILDESYADRGFIFGLEPPQYSEKLYTSFGPPREIGMSLTYSF
ncbi:MAG: TonB-dependent receptor plug domain-containing protein [Candidatus Marinimicrobia bacterium]|nr:TonB-dependent receptor plug domain-containing protein [Candidatus Neomarinimicrobiota bacterium]MDA1363438.1 TonB-dependent receptor plug domain-containing protein [Candidatus Neomarinimicrobiota bacterium]